MERKAVLVLVAVVALIAESKESESRGASSCLHLNLAEDIDNALQKCTKCCRKSHMQQAVYDRGNGLECHCEEAKGINKCALIKAPRNLFQWADKMQACKKCCADLGEVGKIPKFNRRCSCKELPEW